MRALLLFIFLIPALRAAAQRTETFDLHPESGSKIEVTSIFSVVPPTGFAPIQVRITNNTDSEMTVPITSTSAVGGYYGRRHSLRSSFSITAPPRKSSDRELMVPLCPNSEIGGYSGGDLELSVTTPLGNSLASFQVGGHGETPFAAYSQNLAQHNITDINKYAEGILSRGGRSGAAFAALFDATQLPSDWRGLAGVDVLSISSDEWSALPPGASNAVLQWVKLGGTLDLYQKAGAPPLPQAAKTGKNPLGSGSIRTTAWDGDELKGNSASSTIGSALSGGVRRVEAVQEMASEAQPLYAAMERKDFAAGQVGIILLIFGIMVGPVNLFVFARPGRRHRLFYTTPLISGAAALILLVAIYFQDGTGGKGHRAAVVYLDAEDHNAYIHQQQICRTGVLFSSGFSTESPVHLTQAVLPDSRWTRFKGDSSGRGYSRSSPGEAQSFNVNDNNYAGDWFQSRAEQAQIIDAVQPTRGRLELKPGSNPPVLISSLPATLDAVYYIDTDGNPWTAPGRLTTGAEVTLEQVDAKKFQNWLSSQLDFTAGSYPASLDGNALRGHFYAVSADPAAGSVTTSTSIEWATTHVFLFGPLK